MLKLRPEQLATLTKDAAEQARDTLVRACWRACPPIEAMPVAGVGLELKDAMGRVSRLKWGQEGWTLTTATGRSITLSHDVNRRSGRGRHADRR